MKDFVKLVSLATMFAVTLLAIAIAIASPLCNAQDTTSSLTALFDMAGPSDVQETATPIADVGDFLVTDVAVSSRGLFAVSDIVTLAPAQYPVSDFDVVTLDHEKPHQSPVQKLAPVQYEEPRIFRGSGGPVRRWISNRRSGGGFRLFRGFGGC